MKKLMIGVVASVIATSAIAGLCDIASDVTGCEAYDVTVSLKTLGEKILKCKETCAVDANCIPYYINANRTFKGILWMCEADCSFEGAQLILWRTNKGHNYCVGSLIYPDMATMQYKALDFKNDLLGLVNRYGKKANKIQMAWQLPAAQECWWDASTKTVSTDSKKGNALPDYDLVFAGFGTYDAKKSVVKSVSGGVAGYAGADPTDGKCTYPYGFLVSTCAEFTSYCDSDGDIEASPATSDKGILAGDASCFAAYGTWKLKYNKKYATGHKSIIAYVPSYAK